MIMVRTVMVDGVSGYRHELRFQPREPQIKEKDHAERNATRGTTHER